MSITSTKRFINSTLESIASINCSTRWSISALLLASTWLDKVIFNACAFAARLLYRAISRATEVMNTAGRTFAICPSACLEVLQESPLGVNGNPYFPLGTHQSASHVISSSPKITFETSR